MPTRWPVCISLGAALAATAAALTWQRGPATTILCTPLLLLGAAAALVDLREYRLPDAIGWGDIKLAPSLGAYLAHTSWHTLYTGLMSWWLLILLTATLAAASRRRRTKPLPYGPAMLLGTLSAIALS